MAMRQFLSLLLVIAIAITNAGTEIRLSGIQSMDDFVQACSGRHGKHAFHYHNGSMSTSPQWVPYCVLQDESGNVVALFLDNIAAIRFEEE